MKPNAFLYVNSQGIGLLVKGKDGFLDISAAIISIKEYIDDITDEYRIDVDSFVLSGKNISYDFNRLSTKDKYEVIIKADFYDHVLEKKYSNCKATNVILGIYENGELVKQKVSFKSNDLCINVTPK